MSVEAIVRVIDVETADEVERIVGAARQRASTMVAEAEATAEARVRLACERAEPGYRAEAMRLVNSARLRLLERRAEESAAFVDGVFRRAEERLTAIAADSGCERWRRALDCLVEEAVRLIGPGAVVRVRRIDAPVAGPAVERLGARLEIVDESGMAPGVLASSPDGRIDVEATLPVRLARARTTLAEPIVGRLGVGE